MKYFDKNNKQIKNGMTIKHDDGDIEKVYSCGGNDLGVNASNEVYLKNHPNARREYYILSNYDLKEWQIIEEVE